MLVRVFIFIAIAGKMKYFKKVPVTGDDPQGLIQVTSECIRLHNWEQTQTMDLVKWPANAAPLSGFALGTRAGRNYFMHAESEEVCFCSCTALALSALSFSSLVFLNFMFQGMCKMGAGRSTGWRKHCF